MNHEHVVPVRLVGDREPVGVEELPGFDLDVDEPVPALAFESVLFCMPGMTTLIQMPEE